MIAIKKVKGKKAINGKTLDMILEGLDPVHFNPDIVKDIFNKIDSEDALVEELKRIKPDNTPANILLYIMHLTDLSLMDSTKILDKVL